MSVVVSDPCSFDLVLSKVGLVVWVCIWVNDEAAVVSSGASDEPVTDVWAMGPMWGLIAMWHETESGFSAKAE